jgi:hypothetical protein
MSRFKGSPIHGLPGKLPPGEEILWQAAPRWQTLAVRAFRIKWVAAYFSLLVAWRIGGSLMAGHDLHYAVASGLSGIILGAVVVGIFSAYSWIISRSTSYTITNRRVVITYGMALPKSLNLPFARIEGADMALNPDGTGNILLHLPEKTRLSYILLWPHVRAGAKSRPEPMLRAVVDPQKAAQILSQAFADSIGTDERTVTTEARAKAEPAVLPPQGISQGLPA